MENHIRDVELVQKYLDRSATREERHELEYRLKEEPHLQSLLKEQKLLIAGIRNAHLRIKLEQLRTLEQALPSLSNGKVVPFDLVKRYVKPLSIAALLIISASIYLYTRQSESSDVLFQRYFEPYPNVFEPTQRGTGGSQDLRAEAFHSYDIGDYATAVKLFNELIAVKPEAEILLLLGNANLMIGHNEEAKNNFLTLIKDFDELDEQGKWFLSMCYLKQGEKEKAVLILEELGDPKLTYSKKARKLLDEAD